MLIRLRATPSPRRSRSVRGAPPFSGRSGRAAALLSAVLLGGLPATGCVNGTEAVTLRVLASSELTDLGPVLTDLRRATGVRLVMDYRGTVRAGAELTPGKYRHDLAWLSSDRVLRLRPGGAGPAGERPLATSTMQSPVVIGLKRAAAERLRRTARTTRLSWADLAAGASAGRVRFGMANPNTANSGLVALIGVATAAAGTGGALRPEDVTCDRLQGFFSGQSFTADTSEGLTERFVELQERADGLIGYESTLLALNATGRLREPLEIVYPRDGIVVSDYPLLLLDPAKREAYDRVVTWLRGRTAQEKIMRRTLRRPIDPAVPRDPRLNAPIGNALYFPDSAEVVDRLLADYGERADPGHVLFVLDFSASMRGERAAALRETFAGLGGSDDSSAGKFVRFHPGEQVTVIRFGGRVLGERSFVVDGGGGMTSLQEFVRSGDFDGRTAIWSALDHAYRRAGEIRRARPGQQVSIVLMTDGRNNTGMSLPEVLRRHGAAGDDVHTYTIRFGEADPAELDRAARALGGRMADGTATSLLNAFKETRGCR